ncbi:hypothetical protein SacmaDRAFT_4592 [Saccharomonospora marina XMU15]|uniref:Uncharacterized protein n=1 Tax=Saccharomonospora marina XMU15 TaxID=882083 RepID=H5XBY8_9PSEU|nr:DUF6222 family protein [Saccharomonospora marina]EHR52775.1 hypothetical protein SacmaDRAFT_4592 [Saccharomonospora marina XMU15]
MTRKPAWRKGPRKSWRRYAVTDEASELALQRCDPDAEASRTPQLAHGFRWRDLVAEIEAERAFREEGEVRAA